MKTSLSTTQATKAPKAELTAWLTFLLASACGIIAANIYYAQPLLGNISADLSLSAQASGWIVTLTQIGYGLGLLVIVPLADLVENRRLALMILGIAVIGLLLSSLAKNAGVFLLAASLVGLGSVAVQVLVPYAAHLAAGRAVGNG